MNKLLLIFCGISIIAGTSCKQPKEAAAAPAAENAETAVKAKDDTFPSQSRLILTFFSVASGIDQKALMRFEEFIGEYAGEMGINIDYEKTHWGREGETDFCLELTELDPEQQADFVSRTRKLMETAEHLSIYENAPCKHRRKRE